MTLAQLLVQQLQADADAETEQKMQAYMKTPQAFLACQHRYENSCFDRQLYNF